MKFVNKMKTEGTVVETNSNDMYDNLGITDSDVRNKIRKTMRDILNQEIDDYRSKIRESIYGTESQVGIDAIIEYVCERYMITPEAMQATNRKRNVIECRQVIHWMLKNNVTFNTMSLEAIGNIVGGKDHATVLHSVKQINNLIQTDRPFRERLMIMCNELGARTTWMPSDGQLLITGYVKFDIQNKEDETIPS